MNPLDKENVLRDAMAVLIAVLLAAPALAVDINDATITGRVSFKEVCNTSCGPTGPFARVIVDNADGTFVPLFCSGTAPGSAQLLAACQSAKVGDKVIINGAFRFNSEDGCHFIEPRLFAVYEPAPPSDERFAADH